MPRYVFRDELLVGQPLFRRIAPELTAHAQVQRFGGSFREPIRQRLQQDVVVVVVRALNRSRCGSIPMPAVTANAPM